MSPGVWTSVGRVVRRNSRTFWLGSALMAGDRRRATRAVYAACRVGDDAVDLDPWPRSALAAWERRIEAAYLGHPRAPWERALAWAVRRYPIPHHAFGDLAAGFRTDLEVVRIPDLTALETYCYRVAGTVGLMIAPVCGADNPVARAPADRLGRAMQLTNCLRDVGEDLQRDRIYLPRDLLDAHGVTEDDLRAGHPTARYRAVMEHLATIAWQGYEEGLDGLVHLRHHRTAVAFAALQYREILTGLRASGWDNLRTRTVVPARRRAVLLGDALAATHRIADRPPLSARLRRAV
jgi:15-cis-phytoene synthase